MSRRIAKARSGGRNPSMTISGAVTAEAASLLVDPVPDIPLLPAEDQLQAVAVGIVEIDAMVVAGAAGYRDPVPFELSLERLVGACNIERQMVEIAPRIRRRAILLE